MGSWCLAQEENDHGQSMVLRCQGAPIAWKDPKRYSIAAIGIDD